MTVELAAYIALKAQIYQGHQVKINITGVSMEPLAQEGNVAVICNTERFRLGDIVVFANEESVLFIHRIVAINPINILTKGDHAVNAERITRKQLIGIVVSIIKGDKYYSTKHRFINRIIAHISLSHYRFWMKYGERRDCFQNWRIKLIEKFDALLYD